MRIVKRNALSAIVLISSVTAYDSTTEDPTTTSEAPPTCGGIRLPTYVWGDNYAVQYLADIVVTASTCYAVSGNNADLMDSCQIEFMTALMSATSEECASCITSIDASECIMTCGLDASSEECLTCSIAAGDSAASTCDILDGTPSGSSSIATMLIGAVIGVAVLVL